MVRENIKVASVKEAKHPAGGAGRRIQDRLRAHHAIQRADSRGTRAASWTNWKSRGMQAFILDLRYNPGGLLNSAVEVAGQFLPPKTWSFPPKVASPSQSRQYPHCRHREAAAEIIPMAMLINGGSASGSEIVAGALKDLNRAILVGETTFGKGSVQSVIQLQDGSAMRLTTAKYYTPSKKVIHEHGVTPTIRATHVPPSRSACS